jgi:hypothetical protein
MGIDSGDTAWVGCWDDAAVAQAVARASSPGFDDWWSRVAGSGFCARPVHLLGVDRGGGLLRVLGRCKNRRASVCPSCSQLYAADTWQLIHAGIAGGHHGIPEAVASHPAVFVTLTAPSFGPVHSVHENATGKARKCHPGNTFRRCPHGRPLWCGAVHDAGDARMGEPLCPQCYDYGAHVLFTWWAPELWRRFTIALRRKVSSAIRAASGDSNLVRVSFVKVVEFQRRAVPHFHTVIRLDGPPGSDGEPTPPPVGVRIDAAGLAGLVHRAAAQVSVEVAAPNTTIVALRFGTQTDVQPITPPVSRAKQPVSHRDWMIEVVTPSAVWVARRVGWRGIWPSTCASRWPSSGWHRSACRRLRSTPWTCATTSAPSCPRCGIWRACPGMRRCCAGCTPLGIGGMSPPNRGDSRPLWLRCAPAEQPGTSSTPALVS